MANQEGDGRLGAAPATALRGLNFTLLIFIALPLLMVTGMGVRLGFTQIHEFQQALLKNDLDLVARAVQGPVSDALHRGEPDGVEAAMQSIFSIERVYGASVFDHKGRHIASGGIAESDLTQSAIPRLLADTGEKQEQYREIHGRNVFSYFLPLFDRSGQTSGFLQITRRYDDFTNSLHMLTQIAWVLWGVLAVTIVATLLLGHYGGIGRHVEHLLRVMARISNGEIHYRVKEAGPQEVRAIGHGLNRMLNAIQHSEAQLETRRKEQYLLQQQLSEADKMATVGRTAQGFAHELGAPLSVIDGRARRLQRSGGMSLDASKDIEAIRRQVQHLSAMVRQLLDFSRVGHGRKAAFSVSYLLRVVQSGLDIDSFQDRLRLELPDSTPRLYGDCEQLSLALLNIIRNALQASWQQVVIRVTTDRREVRIDIDDDGDGLPNVPPDRLLEPFFTTKASGRGTGLGLAITDRILRDHNGALSLSNRVGGGCRASVTLPLYVQESMQASIP